MSLETQEDVAAPLSAGRTVGVVTWNVQHASAARGVRQADWLAQCSQADIVALTEVAAGASGEHLAATLTGHGYTVHLTDSAGSDYRVLVASRVGDLRPTGMLLEELPHRAASVLVDLPGAAQVAVTGLYVPSRGPQVRRNVAKRAFQHAVAAALPSMVKGNSAQTPVIVMGDLNVVEPGHQPHHAVFGAWEYDFYRAFTGGGLTDAFRHHHRDRVDHSWFGRSGVGYRFDHLFCSTDHLAALTDCRYLHSPRTSGLSDHSALAATLALPPTP